MLNDVRVIRSCRNLLHRQNNFGIAVLPDPFSKGLAHARLSISLLIHVRRSPIHIVVTVCDFLGGFVTCMPHTIEEYEEYFLVEPSPFPQMGHFSFRLMFKIVQTGFCLIGVHIVVMCIMLLCRIHVINKQGSFSRSGGLQAGVDFVKVR